jgi:hypothetical protein
MDGRTFGCILVFTSLMSSGPLAQTDKRQALSPQSGATRMCFRLLGDPEHALLPKIWTWFVA